MNDTWTFTTSFVGRAPCKRPDWAWTALGFRDNLLAVSCSGATEAEALEKAKKMAAARPLGEERG